MYDKTSSFDGDTACADHDIASRVLEALGLDNVSFGPNPMTGGAGILYDVGPDGRSACGVGYPAHTGPLRRCCEWEPYTKLDKRRLPA